MKAKNPKDPIAMTRHKGFTLVEILIAMFIFVVVISTLYSAYTGAFRNMDETQYRTEIYEMARIALGRMVEDLESAYLSEALKSAAPEEDQVQSLRFVGEAVEIKGRRADTLRFISKAHLDFYGEARDVGTAQIAYNVGEADEEGEPFVLYRSDTPGVGGEIAEGSGGLVLCEDLYSVNFIYYNAEGEEYDSWDSSTEQFKDQLPSVVSIVLEFVNRFNPEAPFKFKTGVALPMAGGLT